MAIAEIELVGGPMDGAFVPYPSAQQHIVIGFGSRCHATMGIAVYAVVRDGCPESCTLGCNVHAVHAEFAHERHPG